MRTLALFVTFAVVLAGCAGQVDTPTPAGTASPSPPADAPTSTPDPTATPTSDSTATPLPTGELAPGLTDAGVENPVTLASAHQRALLADGAVVETTVEMYYESTVAERSTFRNVVGPGGERALQTGGSVRADGTDPITGEMWLNETTAVTRRVEENRTEYTLRERVDTPESLVWGSVAQRELQFVANDLAVTGVSDRDGLRRVHLAATLDRVGNDGTNDTEVTAVVDERGVVRELVVDVRYGEGDRWRMTYRVVRVGDVRPTPPDWLDSVPPSASLQLTLDIERFEDTYVELAHVHGDAVPEGSTVTLVSDGTVAETRLDEPFGSGSVFLSVTPEGSLTVGDTPPRESAVELGYRVSVAVTAPDCSELFETTIGRPGPRPAGDG